MENTNEIMDYETVDMMDEVVVAEEGTGMSTGLAMLIGAGLTVAGAAVVKLAKKGIAYWKAKKELKKPDKDIQVDDEDLVEVTK